MKQNMTINDSIGAITYSSTVLVDMTLPTTCNAISSTTSHARILTTGLEVKESERSSIIKETNTKLHVSPMHDIIADLVSSSY